MLPYVFMAYNAMPHASTGFTPQRLFYSQCADPLLPVDLMYGCADRAVPQGYSSYVFHQRNLAMQTAEVVREVTGRAVQVQMEQQSKRAAKPHRYAVGDRVLLFHPPNERDVLHTQPWIGPFTVVEVGSDNIIKIQMHTDVPCKAGHGRRPIREKWVSIRNARPFIKTEARALVVTSPQHSSYSEEVASVNRRRFFEYWRVHNLRRMTSGAFSSMGATPQLGGEVSTQTTASSLPTHSAVVLMKKLGGEGVESLRDGSSTRSLLSCTGE
jgi:hypothetical protein